MHVRLGVLAALLAAPFSAHADPASPSVKTSSPDSVASRFSAGFEAVGALPVAAVA